MDRPIHSANCLAISAVRDTRDVNFGQPSESKRKSLVRRAVFASLVGTGVEWYDYFIFATASTLVFGDLFFPATDPMIGAIKAFAVFGVGFFVRPLGGIVCGSIGDRLGRKKALVLTFMMMGLSTFLIGLLPSTQTVGIWPPVFLVLLRLLQGFGVGGQWGGAALVAVEYAPESKRGAYGSVPQFGNAIGLVAATGAFALVSRLPHAELMSWGWRIPFLFSIVLVAVGLFIRFRLTETPAFQAAQREAELKRVQGQPVDQDAQSKLPLVRVIRDFWRPLLLAMGMRLGETAFGYIILTIGLAYATHYTTVPAVHILWAGTIATAAAGFSYYFFGSLSDRIGRRRTFILGAFVGPASIFPFFWILHSANIVLVYGIYIVAYTIGVGATDAVEPSFFPSYSARMFATREYLSPRKFPAYWLVLGPWRPPRCWCGHTEIRGPLQRLRCCVR